MNLARRFQDDTHHVFFAERQDQVKKILKKNNIDVVVLVLNRLKREGLSILKLIKKIKFFTEVIIINSSEQIHLSIEGMKLGAFDDFFVPVDIDSLIRRVLDAFDQKKKRESTKKSLRRRYQDAMIAAAFAEAGEPGIALEFLEKGKTPPEKSKHRKKERKNG